MLFNSVQYAFFLPVALLVYHVAPAWLRLWILLAASWFFYACWKPVFLVLIVLLTAINYLLGAGLEKCGERRKARMGMLWAGISMNLGVLAYFKYSGFFLQNLEAGAGRLGIHIVTHWVSFAAPLGISFFVFEFIHYLADVSGGRPAVKSPLKFAIFAAFFPTQIAGPIKRYEDFVPQLDRPAPFRWGNIEWGLQLLIIGLFKKTVLADNLAPIVARGFGGAPGIGEAWLVAVAFAMQIYFDFAGYTDMGRGAALMFGYDVPVNFLRPYLASDISLFWRRWHVSLSTWLRDYLFIPLGGSRGSLAKTTFTVLTTMVLCGLWHGANWTFVAMGFYFGVLLIVNAAWKRAIHSSRGSEKPMNPVLHAGCVLFTFSCVCVGWVFFRAEDLSQAWMMIRAMCGFHSGNAPMLDAGEREFIAVVVCGMFAVEWLVEKREAVRGWVLARMPGIPVDVLWGALRPTVLVLLFVLSLVFQPRTGEMFIYFKF